jgi:DNA-binding CsgD family transcriptional regulator/tetratricopeptide (TPR) repeat protein
MQIRSSVVVGRANELGTVHEALHDARAGHGRAIFLVGEPGIGKSRLAATATGTAFDAGMHTLRGRGSSIGPMVPFRPLTEALMSLVRDGDLDGQLAPFRPALARLAPELARPGDLPGGGSIVMLAEAVLRLLAATGRGRGCLLVLDDLHDADAETLAVLEYLVDNIAGSPVVLLSTVRDDPGPALDLAAAAAQRRTATRLTVRHLGRADTTAMVASCLDTTPDRVPTDLLDQVWADSAGNPFVVEELLQYLVGAGALAAVADGWRLTGTARAGVPAALVRGVAARVGRLDPQAQRILCLAAVVGRRFALPVIRRVTGYDDRTIVAHLHAGVAAQLVVPDEPAPDWYAFRHPLTAEAVLAGLTPIERAELSGRTADAIEALYPELDGDWCALVASLRLAAGDPSGAGRLFAEAGRRALHVGASDSAVTLLERADALLTDQTEAGADCLEWLLVALGETGRFDRALDLVGRIDELGDDGLDRIRRAALHARLAAVANSAGRWSEGMLQVAAARALLGPDASDEDSAPVDAVAASLTLSMPNPDRLAEAAVLATRAAAAAQRAGLHAVTCEAWQLLGMITREHDVAEAEAHFVRSLRLAEQQRLPFTRISALVWLAGSVCLMTGAVAPLLDARKEALRAGAVAVAYSIDSVLGLQAVLRGEYEAAERMLDECWQAASRLRLTRVSQYVLVTRAALAAHQGRRDHMLTAIGEYRGRDGARSPELPLEFGLARAFCALLEERRELAAAELVQAMAYESENPTGFHLAGRHGLNLLVGVLMGRNGWGHYREVVSVPAADMRWNRQFVRFAHAVLLGRDGDHEAATAAVEDALVAGAVYPTAVHLGLRLVAEEAHTAGWGEPVAWLRRAEDHFHDTGATAVASACRSILRRAGATVQQRRTGTDLIPAELRARGITVREYEVLRLVAQRLGNRAVATRLFISPRTVEKHMSSLMAKTGHPDREALIGYAQLINAT